MIQAFRGVFLTLVLVFLAPVQTQANSLDALFAKLKTAPDEATAFQIERRIWETWTQPDDAALSKKMADVISAMRTSNFEKALDLLKVVIRDYPDYAEGYNQRATIRFMKGEDEKSLEDIYETLVREPRHFGAMAGRALIQLRNNKPALAFQSVKAAMAVHPFVRERHLFPELLKQYPQR